MYIKTCFDVGIFWLFLTVFVWFLHHVSLIFYNYELVGHLTKTVLQYLFAEDYKVYTLRISHQAKKNSLILLNQWVQLLRLNLVFSLDLRCDKHKRFMNFAIWIKQYCSITEDDKVYTLSISLILHRKTNKV